jgi:energy-coupling factor transporter ATP-binding protein EcfA2
VPGDIIQISDLSYMYALTETPALDNVSINIREGEYFALVGGSGAGKTSFCISLNGIIPHMTMGGISGSVVVGGQNTLENTVRDMARTVGIVFDNPEFQLSQTTVIEEIALGLENIGVERNEMLRRIEEVLDIVGMTGFEERSPLALSGGQQQRVAIAAALAMYPKVLVLDEPTSNLDPIGKEEVFSVAGRLNKERGMTIVIVEHEVEVIAEYADRIGVMHAGQIKMAGTPQEIFSQVDELAAYGVRPPQVTELADELRKAGSPMAEYPVTLNHAVELAQKLGGR